MTRKKEGIQDMGQKTQPPPSKPIISAPPTLIEEAGPVEAGSLPGTQPPHSFPIVGIGASAGGLGAFEAFFSGLPTDVDPGMAFVLVQHLAPDHKSILNNLIQRYTRMQVFEVVDGMVVQPNCVYIIPPGHDMAFLNGTLQLLEPAAPRGQRLPIDFFFRSLAQDQHERAIGIVLSGTGSDGTLGIRAIKGEGGMVMAQNPESTEFDGMPRSALATGLVDYKLPPAEMPAQLMAYVAHAFGASFPSVAVPTPRQENALKKIFILLRAQTSHDFSQYKQSTIQRRIERRMALHQIPTLEGYVKFLQQTPDEVDRLFRDLLIGVTNFFRDPKAFQALETQVIPKLLDAKSAGGVIRVWCPGCSTGEEAYSLAILLKEHLETLKQGHTVQIFATDIDPQAIAKARTGLYPVGSVADISPERLQRFFTAESNGSGLRIHKSIRDMMVFSEQDVIKDPPFSRLDLISCRNLLIYLNGELQKKLIPLFHYALNPGGTLFLGTSETVGAFDDLFAALNRQAKLYQRKECFPNTDLGGLQPVEIRSRLLSPATAMATKLPRAAGKAASPGKTLLRELTEEALLKVAPAGVLVNRQGDILYLHGRTGLYLELAPGEGGVSNILKTAREGLRRELTTALHRAASTQAFVCCPGLRVKTNSHFTRVNLSVRPVDTHPATPLETPLFLVILEEAPSPPEVSDLELAQQASPSTRADQHDPESAVDARIAALQQDLQVQEEFLQTSNEELKSSNEEMQSVNEELQSTNEELETSKEELQSTNEELATVNNELQIKVANLSQANNDINNLLAGTGIGTVFVDFQLHIQRFTPAASKIIHLLQSDVGRPLHHITSNLVNYSGLVADTRGVLDSLVPKEVEVQTTEGRWFMLRIQPYRTIDNMIEGAVLTFVDITEIQRARDALRRLAVVVSDANDAITVQDLAGRTLAWNPGAVKMYGWSEQEALDLYTRDRTPEGLRAEALARLVQLSQAQILAPYLTQRITKAGAVVEVSVTSTALLDETGRMYAIATTERLLQPPREEARDGRNR